MARAVDDVAVGEDQPVGRETKPEPLPAAPATACGARCADIDADDGRCDAIDGVNDRP